MTNTLHRFGEAETQRDDYIVFAMSSKGINDDGAAEKLQAFLRLAMKYTPVSMGHATKGGMYRPSEKLTPLAHWARPTGADPEVVVKGIDEPSTVAAVFDDVANVEAFLKDLKAASLGISPGVDRVAWSDP